MPRSPNAEAAAKMYRDQIIAHGYGKGDAWKPIASLLLSCGFYVSKSLGWSVTADVVYYREANDFTTGSVATKRGRELGSFLAERLGFERAELRSNIGLYWDDTRFRAMQPNNLVGHAFRSMLVEALMMFGDPEISYAEEVDPHLEFPGHTFVTRSKNPRIDIVARRGSVTTALISSRWRFRHDRVDLIDEAMAYGPAAIRSNPLCKQYAWVGEFSPARLEKVLDHTPGNHANPVLAACVHFEPSLLTQGLRERPVRGALRSLTWMIDETFKWR